MRNDNMKLSEQWFADLLVCPDCRAQLDLRSIPRCHQCGYATNSSRDLRCHKPSRVTLSVNPKLENDPAHSLRDIDTTRPGESFPGPRAGRDSRGLMSEIAHRVSTPGRVLDLGCGPRDQAEAIEYLGHDYVGLDYSSEQADILADAHALPFRDSCFDVILSYAVLEHLHNPQLAIREVERLLIEGGIYIGTVSQGEPFHQSYYHHTVWGLLALLSSSESLRLVKCWGALDTLRSLARMGRYSRVEKKLLALIATLNENVPFLAPRKMKWSVKDREIDTIHRAGSIGFIIQKQSPITDD